MAKRGPKLKPQATKEAAGTARPCREVAVLFPDHASRPDPDCMDPPKWLTAAAKKIWNSKVAGYRQRSQKIDGFQDALAQYCSLESQLIATYRQKHIPTMAMVTAHRVFAAEFYDTPASQVARPGSTKPDGNRFTRNGKRPD